MRNGRIGVLWALTLTATFSSQPGVAGQQKPPMGQKITEFSLPNLDGQTVTLEAFKDDKTLVLFFMGTECPICNLYLPEMMELQKKYAERGVRLVGINPNSNNPRDKVADHAKAYELTLPILLDPDQKLADAVGVTRVPEVAVLDANRAIRYRGRINDRYGYVYKRDQPRRNDLEMAIDEVIAGKEVSVRETTPAGCLIARRRSAGDDVSITYSGEIAGILHSKCAGCHHEGAIAPFALLTYKDAKGWTAMIKETVQDGRMPPWHADARFGHFSNDRSLTSQERDMLIAWIDNGAPEGDPAKAPATPIFDSDQDGWVIGKPDVVFQLPEEVTIPAEGTVPYKYFKTKTDFKDDVYIQAAEARPGNRAVVHHIILLAQPPGSFSRPLFICGTAPGDMPMILPKGVGRKIPAGSTLIWQMHYTPTGKVERDRSEVGFVICKTPPERNAITKGVSNRFFKIPAGADSHPVDSDFVFKQDTLILSFMPHMHLRGKDFKYTAVYPDGKEEVLLSIPKYDFNWQSTYRCAKPVFVPKGTRLHCDAHYDNSTNNPANPDATKEVRWGDQTWEEMMIGWVDYMAAQPSLDLQQER